MTVKNVTASVKARLLAKARQAGRPFQELLQYYCLERFLYRFAQSPYKDVFVLKGALMLNVWKAPLARPTRDIDLLGFVDNSVDNLTAIIKNICAVDVEDDGIVFDPQILVGERIKEDAEYAGVRVRFTAYLDRTKVPMQIDVGFGDVIFPDPQILEYPTMLDFAAPKIRVYPLETVIAEKLHAMVFLGTANSRMKDFFDIWLLAQQFEFDGKTLTTAIKTTFEHRQTEITNNPLALSPAFADLDNIQRQWAAFLRKGLSNGTPSDLGEILEMLRVFLHPALQSIADTESFESKWTPPGPWQHKSNWVSIDNE